MSYQPAYHTSFDSIDGHRWSIVISINADDGETIDDMEISLEGDEPCVIEWAETDKQDVVQASTCTLRVSNESDRQMMQLMTRRDAVVSIGVGGHHYWFGHLDDSIYEEPYSFVEGYVTELVFSDFGILSRKPFTLTGRQCVWDIVADCLELTSSTVVNYLTSLKHPKEQTPVKLKDLYINADRFRADGDGWGEFTSKREALEEVLRPLGLRIIQKKGEIWVYDIEWMRDHDELHEPVCWKGTDAYLHGSETYGWYEEAFEPDAEETLAEDSIKEDLENQPVPTRYRADYYDEPSDDWDVGFYIWLEGVTGTGEHYGTKRFKTRPFLTSGTDTGHAWRVYCQHTPGQHVQIPPHVLSNPFVYWPVSDPQGIGPVAESIFAIKTAYIPYVPDAAQFQLRVNLDLLLSPKQNPFEETARWNLVSDYGGFSPSQYKTYWTDDLVRVYVPVKLELLDDNEDVVMHYVNMYALNDPYHRLPCPIGKGFWKTGPAADFGEMMLAYYNDGHETTALEGWATNRQTMPNTRLHQPSLYAKRDQGEYVPMPPQAGRLVLTVSNCVYCPAGIISEVQKKIRWHLLKDAKITLVKANTVDDGIPTDTVYDRDAFDQHGDKTSETLQACTWKQGVAPSARGLYFNKQGIVYEQFLKLGRPFARTLGEHRLLDHVDQTCYPQPVLSGTAELNTEFIAYTDASTPGVFLVTAQRQDLHLGTEEVTMARIAGINGFVYESRWSCPVCVQEDITPRYSHAWSCPVCAQEEQQQLNN